VERPGLRLCGGTRSHEAKSYRRNDGWPRAFVGLRAPARILVGGDRTGLLLRLCRHDGETDSRRSSGVRREIHHWQAARRGRAAFVGRTNRVASHGRRPSPNRSASVIRRLLLASILAASPYVASAQADTSTTSFNVNGLNVILRRNTANEV